MYVCRCSGVRKREVEECIERFVRFMMVSGESVERKKVLNMWAGIICEGLGGASPVFYRKHQAQESPT